MRSLLYDFLASVCTSFVIASRETMLETVNFADKVDQLGAEVKIGGVPLKAEGVANLPDSIIGLGRAKFKSEAYLGMNKDGQPVVTLKRWPFGSAARFRYELEFERMPPLESIEILRDRANEIGQQRVQEHRLKVSINDQDLPTEALEELLRIRLDKEREENEREANGQRAG